MPELSLPEQPAYRRFLAGGAGPLRLSLPGALLVAGGGLTLLGIGRAASDLGGSAGVAIAWPSAAAAMLGAWLVAALAARWLGSRLGLAAGLIQMAGMFVLFSGMGAVRRCPRRGSPLGDASWVKTTARLEFESTLRPRGRRESSSGSENTEQRGLTRFRFQRQITVQL